MIFKKTISFVASTIKFVIFFLFITETLAQENKLRKYQNDEGILSIMYHRFNEFKYPSTNIGMDEFKSQIQIIKRNNFEFLNPKDFEIEFFNTNKNKKIFLTIDDAFMSFYKNAWPFLKENEIPFILFVSTKPIGKKGYMSWSQIKEIEKYDFTAIGNHSHSHEYLVNYNFDIFKNDIDKSIEIFKNNLGYNPELFSYPFGEYSLEQKEYIEKNFKFAFGQQSGVIDINKNHYELPRFPINEKYGDLDRFNFLVRLGPLEFNEISIKDMLLSKKDNPPELIVSFFENQKGILKINCFSNAGGSWGKPETNFLKNKLYIKFEQKFQTRRGRVNCSMQDNNLWRWFGLQFTFKEN